MTRTEADLRAVYAEPCDADAHSVGELERRLIDSWSDPDAQRRVRPRVATWAAAAASAAAVAAVTIGVVVALPPSHPSSQPASGSSPTHASGAHQSTGQKQQRLARERRLAAAERRAEAMRLAARAAAAAAAASKITSGEAVQTFVNLLPRPGTISQRTGGRSLGWVGGTFVYDDGNGAAEMAVGLGVPYTYHGQLQRQAAGSLCPSVTDGDPCTNLPSGAQYTVYQGDANIPGGAKDWELRLLNPNGVEVDLTEWNSPIEKGGAQTRTDPPLTVAELLAIAQSPDWNPHG